MTKFKLAAIAALAITAAVVGSQVQAGAYDSPYAPTYSSYPVYSSYQASSCPSGQCSSGQCSSGQCPSGRCGSAYGRRQTQRARLTRIRPTRRQPLTASTAVVRRAIARTAAAGRARAAVRTAAVVPMDAAEHVPREPASREIARPIVRTDSAVRVAIATEVSHTEMTTPARFTDGPTTRRQRRRGIRRRIGHRVRRTVAISIRGPRIGTAGTANSRVRSTSKPAYDQ